MDKTTKCGSCRYSRSLSGTIGDQEICCLYILAKGKPRDEPVSDECSKFEPRKKRTRNGLPDFTRRE